MAVRIRLRRLGRRHSPAYRVVIANSRSPRDGRFIEDVGYYNPTFPQGDARRLSLNIERIKHWIANGAKATERVEKLYGKFEESTC